jgi:DNA-binding MarR family transcriptional regulator
MVEPQQLEKAVRALARASRIVERASEDLSFADYRVLSAIHSGEQRAARLADRLALGKPTVSASVDSLHKRGLLERGKVEGDNRAVALSLSDDGRELFERMQGRMMRQLELIAARTADPEAVVDALAGLDGAIDEIVIERHARAAAIDPEALDRTPVL